MCTGVIATTCGRKEGIIFKLLIRLLSLQPIAMKKSVVRLLVFGSFGEKYLTMLLISRT